ncbi:MAG: glycoside hydrolase family 127 protein [Planctomycetota bacterium]|nr:glycoside hydrolase family 127 protein [Planctomycetota bacterium]
MKERNAWLDPRGEGTHGWEEPVYWLKGHGNLAYVLRDEAMIAESKVWIEAALRSLKPDGWFGPDKDRGGAATRLRGRDDLWPNMIMLFCLQDYHDFTGDRRVIDLMTRYFKYLATVPEERFLVGYWPKMRGGDLLFSIHWLYNRTGDTGLLELAEKVHRRTADWTRDVINWHNVNMSQGFGQPTTFWAQSGDPRHLEASYRNFKRIRELYGQVPGGMFGGDENCRPGFTGPRQAVETCGMVEMMLSTETLTSITGDLIWADRCEDVAFNSLPAALTADLKALRYLTAPNLVLSDRRSKSPGLQNGGPMLHMDPHGHRCCQHNWGHGWPYYAEHLWFATPDRGLAAVFYSDSQVTARVGDGTEVTVDENTRYPFSEDVELVVETPTPVRFPLYLRVPGWCEKPRLEIDGREVAVDAKPLHFIRIDRRWSGGEKVRLTLPMKVKVREWANNQGSVSVDRGPLTYSLKIGEKYIQAGGTDEWPAWEIHPTTPWNYGLVLDPGDPAASFEVVERAWPATDMPFTHEGTPVELRAKGRRIPVWQPDTLGLVGKLQPSPVKSKEPLETLTLIPMGAARLRIASFPVIGEGPDAHEWKAPPEPAYKAAASHCWGSDTVRAVADGLLPKSSIDHSIPRLTWWDHRGTKEWVEARFGKPRKVSRVEVYWFDDTGRGGCRVPASWKLLHRAGDRWVEVKRPGGYGVARDRFNRTTFEPLETDALRLEVELADGFSAGVLEWKIE